jgi:hypothetical protein
MNIIIEAIKVAKKYYDEENYNHAMRVAAYVAENNLIPNDMKEKCVALAIMHDLMEDTEFDYYKHIDESCYDTYIENCICLLTRDKEVVPYDDYLSNIKDKYDSYPEAYWVKVADMKDHLLETDTLTDTLKEKYLKALPCLL